MALAAGERSSQHWNADGYARNARFVADLADPVVAMLAPQPGERILDLGCGDGALTAKLVAPGCRVVGADASAELLRAARARGLDVLRMDGERLGFRPVFDAVFSNAALHWMRRPDAVIAGVQSALRPGGRFVGEFGGRGCVARVEAALLGALARRGIDGRALHPWYFPGDDEYRERLTRGGLRALEVALVERPTRLPGDVADWLATFAGPFLAALPHGDRGDFVAEVRERLRPELCGSDGVWTLDYVRLRFAARKP